MAQLNKTHGGRNERLYLVWMDMRRRCNDPKDANYKFYGARGISVCKEWEDYAVFREWAARADMTRRQKEQNVRSTELMLIKDIVLKIADG